MQENENYLSVVLDTFTGLSDMDKLRSFHNLLDQLSLPYSDSEDLQERLLSATSEIGIRAEEIAYGNFDSPEGAEQMTDLVKKSGRSKERLKIAVVLLEKLHEGGFLDEVQSGDISEVLLDFLDPYQR